MKEWHKREVLRVKNMIAWAHMDTTHPVYLKMEFPTGEWLTIPREWLFPWTPASGPLIHNVLSHGKKDA